MKDKDENTINRLSQYAGTRLRAFWIGYERKEEGKRWIEELISGEEWRVEKRW